MKLRPLIQTITFSAPRPLRIIMAWLAAVTAVALLLTAWGGCINPQKWALPSVAIMAFPAVLAWTLFVGVASFVVRSRWGCCIAAAAVVASIPAFLTYCPLYHQPGAEALKNTPDDPDRTFTVMTFNALWWIQEYPTKGRDAVGNESLQYVLDADPDILCTQENRGVYQALTAGGTVGQVDSLFRRYPYREVARDYDGITIYSKYPITRILQQDVMSSSAIYAAYRISMHGRLLTVVNCHLQSLGLSPEDKASFAALTGDEAAGAGFGALMRSAKETYRTVTHKLFDAYRNRAVQAADLRTLVDSIKGNVIVCGDFNDVPGCYAVRTVMGSDLSDAYCGAGLGPALTFRANNMRFRIDHILYRGRFHPIAAGAGKGASDHFPLYATFEWDTPPDDDDSTSY